MVSSPEWYSNPKWGDAEEERFLQKLARARDKRRYLRLKAQSLCETGDPVRQRVAVELLERCLREWPGSNDEGSDHHTLGRLHEALGEFDPATVHYRHAVAYEGKQGNLQSYAFVSFLLFILRHAPQLRDEARSIIESRAQEMRNDSSYMVRFALRATRAILRFQSGDRKNAGTDAAWALNAAARVHSGLDRYPTLGLVKGVDDLILQVRRIAQQTLGTSDFAPQ